jgi:hypothetical protein
VHRLVPGFEITPLKYGKSPHFHPFSTGFLMDLEPLMYGEFPWKRGQDTSQPEGGAGTRIFLPFFLNYGNQPIIFTPHPFF